jgi:hypothetical protein
MAAVAFSPDEAVAQAALAAHACGVAAAANWDARLRTANGTLIVPHETLWGAKLLEGATRGVSAEHIAPSRGPVADGYLRGLISGDRRHQAVVSYPDGTLITVMPAPRGNAGGVPVEDHWQASCGGEYAYALSPLRAVEALYARRQRERDWRWQLAEYLALFPLAEEHLPAYRRLLNEAAARLNPDDAAVFTAALARRTEES